LRTIHIAVMGALCNYLHLEATQVGYGAPKENSRNHRRTRTKVLSLIDHQATDWLEIGRRSTLDLRTACLGAPHTKPWPFWPRRSSNAR